MRSLFTRFFQLEAASGLLLIAAAILALIINNSPLSYLYSGLLDVPSPFRSVRCTSPNRCCFGSTTA